MQYNKINQLFPINEQLQFISKLPNYKVNQYQNLLQNNQQYPNIHSKKQFQTIIDTYTVHNKLEYLARLIQIIQYTLKRKNSKELLEFLIKESRDDIQYYKGLRHFLHKTKFHRNTRYQTQPEFIYYHLLPLIIKKNKIHIQKIMDIGCGNGAKASELGKLLKLQKHQIICADIEQWFNYNNIERKKRDIELLKISEKGDIIYEKNSVNLITLIHTMHHWNYATTKEYISRMRNLRDILSDDGFIIIIEHDVFTEEDAMLLDIEHGLWECVLNDNVKEFYKDFESKYINPIELDLIMTKSGFQKFKSEYFDAGIIGKIMIPDNSYMGIYKKI